MLVIVTHWAYRGCPHSVGSLGKIAILRQVLAFRFRTLVIYSTRDMGQKGELFTLTKVPVTPGLPTKLNESCGLRDWPNKCFLPRQEDFRYAFSQVYSGCIV